MEIKRSADITITLPTNGDLSAKSSPGTISYDRYCEAGGIFSEDDHSEFFRAGTDAMRGIHPLERKHLIQGLGLAGRSELPTDEARDATAIFYAVLREAPKLVPVLDGWAGANSDQVVFAQALLATEGEQAYLSFKNMFPNIFKIQA